MHGEPTKLLNASQICVSNPSTPSSGSPALNLNLSLSLLDSDAGKGSWGRTTKAEQILCSLFLCSYAWQHPSKVFCFVFFKRSGEGQAKEKEHLKQTPQ